MVIKKHEDKLRPWVVWVINIVYIDNYVDNQMQIFEFENTGEIAFVLLLFRYYVLFGN